MLYKWPTACSRITKHGASNPTAQNSSIWMKEAYLEDLRKSSYYIYRLWTDHDKGNYRFYLHLLHIRTMMYA
jgi:hypothetical protein